MKKLLVTSFLLALFLTACSGNPGATAPQTEAPVQTAAPATSPAVEITLPTKAPVTEPERSALYIPGVDVEDVIQWFNEVCLSAEFVNSGNPSFIQKWDTPIFYTVHGQPTQEDLAVLEGFTQWLNALDGFPGISEATEEFQSSLNIYFCSQEELVWRLGDNFHGMDGGVTFWYTGDDRIYDAIICVRSDLDQYVRNSVILEELYNGLGPVQDTWLRPDSLIYADYSEPQALTATDELILALLYHPDMRCGMDSAQCEEVIRKLYY